MEVGIQAALLDGQLSLMMRDLIMYGKSEAYVGQDVDAWDGLFVPESS